MKYILLLLLISISYVSSAQIPQKVLYSLQKAGKNRGELERVIHHYQQDKDSLKLKACYFLLENNDIDFTKKYLIFQPHNAKL